MTVNNLAKGPIIGSLALLVFELTTFCWMSPSCVGENKLEFGNSQLTKLVENVIKFKKACYPIKYQVKYKYVKLTTKILQS